MIMRNHPFQTRVGASAKWIKEKIGRATIERTMNLYGHLWPDEAEDAPGRRSRL